MKLYLENESGMSLRAGLYKDKRTDPEVTRKELRYGPERACSSRTR